MKFTTFLALAFAVLSFAACGGGGEKALVRKWQFDVDGFKAELNTQIEAQKKSIQDSLKQAEGKGDTEAAEMFKMQLEMGEKMMSGMIDQLVKGLDDMVMDFQTGGKLVAKGGMIGKDKEDVGTWSLSKDGKELTIVNGDKKETTMLVKSLTAKQLVVSPKPDPKGPKGPDFSIVLKPAS